MVGEGMLIMSLVQQNNSVSGKPQALPEDSPGFDLKGGVPLISDICEEVHRKKEYHWPGRIARHAARAVRGKSCL
jgi:hypothetical protein